MTRLGKYLIGRSLGKGAMGTVYEAFDPVLQRTVAIKTVLPSHLGSADGAGVLIRFKREAQAAGRLNHPGIVAVYDYGEETAQRDATLMPGTQAQLPEGERVAYIAMEFVEGRELKSFFDANERFSLDDIARIMGDILSALDHAHHKGVTHRDIKPGNLIMLADGRVKVADFGIARIETSELTQVGEVMGTPSYMSPEQFQGRAVDLRTDIFSCGVILYQFLTGEKPFVGNTTTLMYKVLGEEPLAPSLLNAALPPAWDQVVGKAIAKNPENRFQTAGAFAQAIRDAMANRAPVGVDMNQTLSMHTALKPSAATGMGTRETAANPAQAHHDAPSDKVDQTMAVARPVAPEKTRRVVWGIAGLLLVLGAVGAYRVSGPDGTAPAASGVPVPSNVLPAVAPVQAQASEPVTPAATDAAAATPAPTTQGAVGSPPAVAEPKGRQGSKPAPAPTAPTRAARPVEARADTDPTPTRPVRCALILQKAAMSEPMSAEERVFLSTSCQ